MWLSNSFVKSGKYFAGIICRESASYVHGLSNYPPTPLLLFNTYPFKDFNSGCVIPIYTPRLEYDDTIQLENRLYVTNKERTICDMINYESNEEYLYQTVESYLYDTNTDKDTLIKYAEKYNCTEKMIYYIETLDDYLAESY